MKLHSPKTRFSLTESGQTNPVRFSMCRVEGEDIHMLNPWFKCRDYFSDWLLATRVSRDYPKIHGFLPEGHSNPIPLDSLTLAITAPKEQMDNIKFNIGTIELAQGNELEAPTIIHSLDDVAVVRFDKFWLTSTQHLSLLTMVLRTFCMVKNEKEVDLHNFLVGISKMNGYNSDATNWQAIVGQINVVDFIRATIPLQEELIEFQLAAFKEADPSTSEMHGYGGVLSFCRYLNSKNYVNGTKFTAKMLGRLSEIISHDSETKTA